MHQGSAHDQDYHQRDSLIGREVELERVREAFARSRLVTIIGDGGIGKTSLARAYARSAQAGIEASSTGGVSFVGLSVASSPGEVPNLVAEALGIPLRPGLDAGAAIALALTDQTADKASLVVLDNFEHVLYAARFVEGLRAACPSLSILVTSRIRLGLRAERVMPLTGLSLASGRREGQDVVETTRPPALGLMIERLQEAHPDFSPSAEEETALLDLCRRLEGNPLSIVLAAARIAMYPELARSSPDTLLDFVASPDHRQGGRHASLEETLDWSYRLLPSPPRVLLTELGAFNGEVSLPSLEAVSSLGDELAGALVELERAGFLTVEDRGASSPRIERPEALAEYSTRLLARASFRARTLTARMKLYAGLASAADAEASSGQSGSASKRLLRELPSLRDAVARAAEEGDRPQAAVVTLAAYRTIQAEGRYAIGLSIVEACLEETNLMRTSRIDNEQYARLQWRRAGFLFRLGRLEDTAEALTSALERAERLEDRSIRAELLISLAVARLELGHFEAAETAFIAAERLAEELGERRLKMRLAVNRGLSSDLRGDYDAAGSLYDEAEALARSLGDAASLGLILKNAAARLWRLERYEEAAGAYRVALAVIEPTGIVFAQAAARIGLGYALVRLGRPVEARIELDAAFALSREAGIDDSPSPESCLAYAELAEAAGQAAEAKSLIAEALRVAVRTGERRLLAPALEAAAAYLPSEDASRALGLASSLRERLRLPAPPWDARRVAALSAAYLPLPTAPDGTWLEILSTALALADLVLPPRPREASSKSIADCPRRH